MPRSGPTPDSATYAQYRAPSPHPTIARREARTSITARDALQAASLEVQALALARRPSWRAGEHRVTATRHQREGGANPLVHRGRQRPDPLQATVLIRLPRSSADGAGRWAPRAGAVDQVDRGLSKLLLHRLGLPGPSTTTSVSARSRWLSGTATTRS
ncbi:MAG TPA: hypothetical protein VK601_13225, partial [Kofleriaceae bacterium]|nr:hypothetical protein [Kofleriaceae bacterium]